MPLALDATIGGPAANTYVLEADVDNYAPATAYAAAWAALQAGSQARLGLIVRACLELDKLLRYDGQPATMTQARQWPRIYVVKPGYGTVGYPYTYYDSTVIPQAMKDAQALLVCWLAKNDPTGANDVFGADPNQAIASVGVGPVTVDFRSTATGQAFANPGQAFLRTSIRPMLEQYNLLGPAAVRLTR